jgi:hypothetical protein
LSIWGKKLHLFTNETGIVEIIFQVSGPTEIRGDPLINRSRMFEGNGGNVRFHTFWRGTEHASLHDGFKVIVLGAVILEDIRNREKPGAVDQGKTAEHWNTWCAIANDVTVSAIQRNAIEERVQKP